jgi:hypothetical protein
VYPLFFPPAPPSIGRTEKGIKRREKHNRKIAGIAGFGTSSWSKKDPFLPSSRDDQYNSAVVVMTLVSA